MNSIHLILLCSIIIFDELNSSCISGPKLSFSEIYALNSSYYNTFDILNSFYNIGHKLSFSEIL
jgi:hypothetical protein